MLGVGMAIPLFSPISPIHTNCVNQYHNGQGLPENRIYSWPLRMNGPTFQEACCQKTC